MLETPNNVVTASRLAVYRMKWVFQYEGMTRRTVATAGSRVAIVMALLQVVCGRIEGRVAHARYDHAMQDGDIVADRRDDGSCIIRRWRASDGALLPVAGHDESYDEEEMYRRLNRLRSTGDTYVREQPTTARLIQP